MSKAVRGVHFIAKTEGDGRYAIFPLDLRAGEKEDERLLYALYDKSTATSALEVADNAYRRGVEDVLRLLRSGKYTDIDRLQQRTRSPLSPPCDIS